MKEFYQSLGNKYTVLLVGFLTGFVIGAIKFSGSSLLIGLLIGIIFAIAAGLIWAFMKKMFPKNVNISLDVTPLFTVVLLIIFFFVISSGGMNKFFFDVGKTFNIEATQKKS